VIIVVISTKLNKINELNIKITRCHLMPPQQHIYNGLVRPANYFIFAWEWTRPPADESMLAQECNRLH